VYHALQQTINIGNIPDRATPIVVTQLSAADVWHASHPPNIEFSYTLPLKPTVHTFIDLVNTMEPWEKEILTYADFTGEPFDFCEDLQPCIRAVSDGSVRRETQGAFGWSIRNEGGITVASGMKPARGGGTVLSYRAEAYGMLSLLRFLIRIAEHAEMSFQWSGVIATDSLSLLDTLFGHDERAR
jgi:hypothetical protein